MIDINNIKKLIALGYQAFKQKNYEQAIKVWQPMIDFCQNEKFSDSDKEIANTYLDLGKCYYRTQQYHKAKTVINRGLNNFPNDLNLLKLEGFNEEKLNNHELALQAWKKVLEQYPKHIEAEQHIRDIRKQIEKKQQQEQYLIRQKEISVDLQKVLLDIDESIKQGLCQDEQIEKYFAEFPNNYQLLLKYAQNAQDNYTKLQRFITLTQLYPYSEEALFELLEVYEEEKQFRQAKLFWQSFTKKNLNIDYSLYKLYAEKVEKHEPREAFFRWLEVYRQFPTYIEVTKKIDSLGKQLKLQKYCGTKNIASQQILSEQHQVSQMFLSGKKAFDAKNYHESNQIWQQAVDLVSDKTYIPADLYLGLGKSYIRSGELDKAEKLVMEGLQVYPNNYNIHFLLPYIAKQKQNWQQAVVLWENLSGKFPKELSAKIELAHSYKQLNQLDKAEMIYRKVIEINDNYFDAYLWLARLLMQVGKIEVALDIWTQIKNKWINKINGHLGVAMCHKSLANYQQAYQAIQQSFEVFPNNVQLLDELVDVIYRSQDYQEGYDKLDKLNFDKPEILEYQKARLLVKLKKFDEAEQKFKSIIELYPNFSRVYLGFADFYTQQRREKEAVDILQYGYDIFQKDENIIMRLIDTLIAYGEKEQAYHVYTSSLPNKDSAQNLFKYRNLINQFSDKKIDLEKLYKLYPDNIDIAVKLANIKLDSYNEDIQSQGIAILYDVQKNNPNILWIKNTIVMGLLKANREDEAMKFAKTISKNRTDSDTLKVLSWLAQKEGDFDKSKQLWQQIISQKHILSVSGKIGNLTYKGNKDIIVEKNDILMFSTMFNEMIHIPFLLNYYRKLGVNKFFIIDNNSTDETAQYLLSQPDVYYFWSSSSYKEAGDGMAWSNYLMDKYAQGNWCVVIDADEYLVYPNIENKKLPELTKYLDEYGYEALASFMLAMYPEDVEHQIAIKSGDNLINKSPYFCNHYYFRKDVYCPYIHVSGGFFYKKNGQMTWCTKTPLIKRNWGVKHIASNHLITSAKVADLTSCLLHLKLVGDFEKKAKLNIERKEHSGGGDAYKEYIKIYATNEKFTEVEGTTKFENSQQLVDLGLIKNPRGF